MDLKDVFIKLDKMNEHVSVLRENTARIGAILEENTRDIRTHIKRTEILEERLDQVEKQQSVWKGAALVISAVFGSLVTFLVRKIG